jgi:hypothetical protein
MPKAQYIIFRVVGPAEARRTVYYTGSKADIAAWSAREGAARIFTRKTHVYDIARDLGAEARPFNAEETAPRVDLVAVLEARVRALEEQLNIADTAAQHFYACANCATGTLCSEGHYFADQLDLHTRATRMMKKRKPYTYRARGVDPKNLMRRD